MGGIGSGGWNASGRSTVESSVRVSVSALNQHGGLRPGASSLWQWSRGGDRYASISMHCEPNRLLLSYAKRCEGGSRNVNEPVALKRRPCRFGGERVYFSCPCCSKAVLYLYLHRGDFVCRVCARITYASRRERERDRHLRAANKLRQRLGAKENDALNGVPPRPRGMWRRTYERIVGQIATREDLAMEELAGWMMAVRSRPPGSLRPRTRFWR